MKADFNDIETYSLEQGAVSISYNQTFELQEARQKAGISIVEFEAMPGVPMWLYGGQTMSKSHLLIWYRLHNRIEAVNSTAQIRKSRSGRSKGTNFSWQKNSR